MKSTKMAKITAILTVLALLASGCGQAAPAPARPGPGPGQVNVNVGVVPAETNAALFVAQERGIFAAHGLHVTIKTIASTAGVAPQLVSGKLDIAAGQLTTWVQAQAKGTGTFHILAPGLMMTPNVNLLVALGSSHITSTSMLSGKTIAVNGATGNGVLMSDNALALYGINPSQVKFKVMGFSQMAAALAARQVDAAYCTEPYCTEMQQQLGAQVITDLNQGAVQGMLVGGYTVTTGWLKKNQQTAEAFTAAIHQASLLADTSSTAARQALMVSLSTNQEVATVMHIGTFPTMLARARILQIAQLMARFGEVSPKTNLAPLVATLSAGTSTAAPPSP